MAENVITPKFRGCYVGIFRATAYEGNEKKTFSIRAAFEPGEDLAALKAQAVDQ